MKKQISPELPQKGKLTAELRDMLAKDKKLKGGANPAEKERARKERGLQAS